MQAITQLRNEINIIKRNHPNWNIGTGIKFSDHTRYYVRDENGSIILYIADYKTHAVVIEMVNEKH